MMTVLLEYINSIDEVVYIFATPQHSEAIVKVKIKIISIHIIGNSTNFLHMKSHHCSVS